MQRNAVILSVENVSKNYSGDVALESISFSAVTGEILGVLGPSGSGKSTLLRLLGGLVMPDDGDVIVAGTSLYRDYEKCMASIGYVPEKPSFYSYMTCMDNLRTFADMYGGITRARLDELIIQFGLADHAYQKTGKCSSSVLCRLAIACAMINSPQLLVISNVFDGLDPLAIVELRRMLKHLAYSCGVTIILTSRLISELERVCDRVMLLNEGRILGIGTVDGIKQASTGKLRHKLLLDRPEIAAAQLRDTEGIVSEQRGDILIIDADQSMIPRIVSILYSMGHLVYEISPIELTLEEAYYRLMRDWARKSPAERGTYGGEANA